MTTKRTAKLRVDIVAKMRARHGLPDPEPEANDSGTARAEPHEDVGTDLTEDECRRIGESDGLMAELRKGPVVRNGHRVDLTADMRQRFKDPQPVPGAVGRGAETPPAGLRVDIAANMRRLVAERGWGEQDSNMNGD